MSKQYRSTNVDCKSVKPYVAELILRCGSPEKASDFCGVGTSTLYRIRHNIHCTIQQETAKKIMKALLDKRKEDRLNANVSPELRKARKTQARIEERMQRLAGY